MQLADCAPPANPTLDEQRDALSKGLGRALRWARDGSLDEAVLLKACLTNLVFDIQIDQSRGGWLWNAIETRGLTAAFRMPLLDALGSISNYRDARQLCEIAVHYARCGDGEFLKTLRRIATRRPLGDDTPIDAEDAVLEFDGLDGFLKLAVVYGKRAKLDQWDWLAGWLIDRAEERFGKQAVKAAIYRSRHSDIVRFRHEWNREIRNFSKRRTRAVRNVAAIGPEEVIQELKTTGRGGFSARHWGEAANDIDLRAVARATLAGSHPNALARFLKIFVDRDWPEDIERLVGLCRHSDPYVSQLAFMAANRISHPSVRALAIESAKAGFTQPYAIGAFVANYVASDEKIILDAIVLSKFEPRTVRLTV